MSERSGGPPTDRMWPKVLALCAHEILPALRRELVTSDELVVQAEASDEGAPSVYIAIGERARIAQLLRPDPAARITFDEWRGGRGDRHASCHPIDGQPVTSW